MAVNKKPASSPHKKAGSGPQAFDIIPRHQVKPSTTSRPVITTTQPEQLDNTLKTAPLTAMTSKSADSQLKHKPLNLTPSDDAEPATGPEPVKPKGVPLSDLLASKQAAVEQPAEETAAAPEPSPEPAKEAADNTNSKTAETSEGEADAPKADEPAKATEETQKEAPADKPEPKPAAATVATAAAGEFDSVDQILKQDDPKKPQPHSQALKDELATIDGDKPADGEEAGEDKPIDDERPHHELYGGKPVIVIHRGRGSHSALNAFLWLLVCLVLAVVIVDVLLDMDIISLSPSLNIPHTSWF